MPLPDFTEIGDLPSGVHRAMLAEVIGRFGCGSDHRKLLGLRLERVYSIAARTGHLLRFAVLARSWPVSLTRTMSMSS